MIPNCEGCKIDYEHLIIYSKNRLHFAGKGLYEKGHLLLIMVNDEGEIIIG